MGSAAALLVLVFLMEQRIRAQHGPSPQPSIWAHPGNVISRGSAVTIFCRTPPGVTKVHLNHYVPNGMWYEHLPPGGREVFEFTLQNMTHASAGSYYCDYYKEGGKPGISARLDLVVTGVYKEKPSLTVALGPQGASEKNVTLLCHLPGSFDIFILCREGSASLPQNCSHQDHNTFLIPPVSPGRGRTYRCFGSYEGNSSLWSLPSDPLELSIPGSSVSTVVWVSVAGASLLLLFLLVLFTYLFCHQAVCSVSRECDDMQAAQLGDRGQVDPQVSAAEDVTYAQLYEKTSPKSDTPQDTSTQPCVYSTLTLSQEESWN